VLSEHELFGITAVQKIDHPIELAHCIAHRAQLLVGDLDLAQCLLLLARDVLAGKMLSAVMDVITWIVTPTSQFPSDQSSRLTVMRLRSPWSRALGVVIGVVVLPWTIQLEQARVNFALQTVVADLRRSLHVQLSHPVPSSPARRRRAPNQSAR